MSATQSVHHLLLIATAQRHQGLVRRCAERETRRVQRAGRIWEVVAGLAPAVFHLILVSALVAVATVADRPVFEPFGLDDQSTVLVALGVNALIALLADLGVGSRLQELAQTPTALRTGLRWSSQVALLIASAVVAVGAALAIAWARARQFASDTDTLFGSRAPGFVGGLSLFTAIGLALFVAAAIVGWHRRDRPRLDSTEMNQRVRQSRLAALARLQNRMWRRVDRGNAAVVRDAARLAYEGFELGTLPTVVFPADTADFVRNERARLDVKETPGARPT